MEAGILMVGTLQGVLSFVLQRQIAESMVPGIHSFVFQKSN